MTSPKTKLLLLAAACAALGILLWFTQPSPGIVTIVGAI